jgi:hypothetical protein
MSAFAVAAFQCRMCGCQAAGGRRCDVCGEPDPVAPAPRAEWRPAAEFAGTLAADRSADLDNALVRQKDTLLAAVDLAASAAGLTRAAGLLDFAAPLWQAAGYGYKVPEVAARLRRRAADLATAERLAAAGLRTGRAAAAARERIAALDELAGG